MRKIFLGLLLFFIVAGVSVVLAKDLILKELLGYSVHRFMGFETKAESVAFDFPLTIHVKNLELKNPPGFSEPVFAKASELYIAMDHRELLRKERVHFYEMRLKIDEIFVEKNEEGLINVKLLKPTLRKRPEELEANIPKKKGMPFYMDRLELSIKRAHYLDRSPTKVEVSDKIIPEPLAPAADLIGRGVKEVGKGFQEVGKGVAEVVPVPLKMPEKKISADLHMEKQVFTDIQRADAIVHVILRKVLYGKTLGQGEAFFSQTAGMVTQQAGTMVKGTGEMVKKIKEQIPVS